LSKTYLAEAAGVVLIAPLLVLLQQGRFHRPLEFRMLFNLLLSKYNKPVSM
jgi:hypothetical protein